MTRRTRSISWNDGLSPEEKSTLRGRIESVSHTIAGLEAMSPALGEQWRAGMLRYYRRVLSELESYGHRSKNIH